MLSRSVTGNSLAFVPHALEEAADIGAQSYAESDAREDDLAFHGTCRQQLDGLPRCEQRERDRDQRIDFLVGAWMGNAAMIIGSDVIVYSWNPDADRDFLRDVLKLSHVDAGGGWLIFGLPPSEVAVHPTDGMDKHELYLICKDVEAFIREMKTRARLHTSARRALRTAHGVDAAERRQARRVVRTKSLPRLRPAADKAATEWRVTAHVQSDGHPRIQWAAVSGLTVFLQCRAVFARHCTGRGARLDIIV